MSFTGHEDHDISLLDAATMTANFRSTQTGSSYIKAEFFGKDAIAAILNQDDCVGIRIYYALDDAGVPKLVIVGVNADEDDLYDGLIAERGSVCPPACANNNSPLNN
jgi:hypothetical protein